MSDALRIEVSGKAGPGFVAAVATAVGAEGSVRIVPEGFAADRLLMRAASGLAIPADAGTRVWTLFADDSPVAKFALRFPSDGDGDALRVSVPSGSPALEAGLSALAAKGDGVSRDDVLALFPTAAEVAGRSAAAQGEPPIPEGVSLMAKICLALIFTLPLAGFIWMCIRFKWI